MSDTLTKTCVCGRTFTDLGGFTRHEKSCRRGKKRLSEALTRAKEVYHAKKARLSLSRRASVDEDAIPSSSTCIGKDKQDLRDGVGEQAVQQVWFRPPFPPKP